MKALNCNKIIYYDIINKRQARSHLLNSSSQSLWMAFSALRHCSWFCNVIRYQKFPKQYNKNIKPKANPLKALSFTYTFNLFSYREYDPSCGKIVTNLIILFIAPLKVVKTMHRDKNMDQ